MFSQTFFSVFNSRSPNFLHHSHLVRDSGYVMSVISYFFMTLT